MDDSLFPTWPAQDPVLAIWVFVATMGLLLLPKLLSLVLVWTQRSERRQFGGALRASAGAFAEIVVSALMAPVMMLFQSIAVIEILAGRDAGWQTQRRDHCGAARALPEIRHPDRERRCDGRKRVRGFIAPSALDVARLREVLLRTPANDNDDHEPLEPFPDGWWASS